MKALLSSVRDSLTLIHGTEWWFVGLLLVVHVVTALLETTGAGLVYLFFKVALDQEALGGITQIQRVYDYMEFSDKSTFMALFTLAVLTAFLLRTAFLAWSAWLNLAVIRTIKRRVSKTLFHGYIHDSYARHLQQSSPVVMANITNNSSGAIAHCTIGLIEIASAGVLVLFFVTTLFVVRPTETVVTCIVLGTMSGLYWWKMHERLTYWGEQLVRAVQGVYRAVSEVFIGLKTIKVMGAERIFEDRFSELVDRQTSVTLKSSFAGQAPRWALEIVLVTGILGLVAGAFAIGRSSEDLVPTLALFGIAALRIMPAFARIMTALQLYKGAVPYLKAILPDYRQFSSADANRGLARGGSTRDAFESTLELENVSFKYEGAGGPAIHEITLRIGRGQFVGFAGQSGSGKTTTADVILGLLSPSEGKVLVDGRVRADGEAAKGGMFAYVPQEPFIIDDSVRMNIALSFSEDEVDERRLSKAVELSALAPVVEKLPDGLGTLLGERGCRLSGGERQRLGLARALYLDADILVLDEPTSSLDAITESEISAVLDRLRGKKTIIMIAHRLSTIARCDQLYYFEGGRVVGRGTFGELMRSTGGFREMVEHLTIESSGDSAEDTVSGRERTRAGLGRQ